MEKISQDVLDEVERVAVQINEEEEAMVKESVLELKLSMYEDGRFTIGKSDDLTIFMAIGMMEYAKGVMLKPVEIERETEDVM